MKKILLRTGLVSGIALVSLAILLTGAMQWKKHIRERNVINSLAFALEYIDNGELHSALRLVDEYRGTRGEFPEYHQEWVEVELFAAIRVPDNKRLEMIYHDYPVKFSKKSDGALVLARYFLMRGKYSQYDSLRKQFSGTDTWLILDADKELQMGNSADALEILQNMPARNNGKLPDLFVWL